jgi:LPXTG-motif cell wall-anchored protein
MKSFGMLLLLAGFASLAMAGTAPAPEISPATGIAGLAMVSGAVLVIRGRRKKS